MLITGINHPVLSLSPAPGTVQILLHFGGSVLLCPLLGTVYSLLHFGGPVQEGGQALVWAGLRHTQHHQEE